jgi:pimeloyl-ACP methyl ester carboxylesterase
VDAVRTALDYARINLHGGSYGTRLGLEVLRQYPSTVRAAVLDGVAPPGMNWAVEMVRRHDTALNVLFEHCRADARCNRAFPGLDSAFYRVVRRLDATPTNVRVGERIQTLDGEALRNFVWHGLFDVQTTRWLPVIIARLDHGDAGLWGRILTEGASDPIGGGMAWGMSFAIECSEAWTVQSPAVVRAAAGALHPAVREHAVRYFAASSDVCRQWDVPPARGLRREPVHSDVPTLLLSGEFDTGTPPAFAELAGRTLSRHYHYVFPYFGHSDGFLSDCHASIVAAFLDDPEHPPPTTCLAELERPVFITEFPAGRRGDRARGSFVLRSMH